MVVRRPCSWCPSWVAVYVLSIAVAWTAAIGVGLIWEWYSNCELIYHVAMAQAQAAVQKDLVLRRWIREHGGVYVPVTEKTPPNPLLAHVPERDIVTPSGRRLTLLNSSYVMRQFYQMYHDSAAVRSHTVSQKPLNPNNRPDPWEAEVLKQFERGLPEVSGVVSMDGQPYLRLMRPLQVESICLKCHAHQDYQVGDVRGAISVAVPLSKLQELRAEFWQSAAGYGVLWVIGLCGIGLLGCRLRYQVVRRDQAEHALRLARDNLERAVQERTAQIAATISNMEEGVVFADAANVIVEVNEYFAKFVGKPREEILGRRIEELHTGEVLAGILAHLERFRTQVGAEPVVVQRALGKAQVIMRLQPIYCDQIYTGVLLNVIDVSELVEARRQAEAATEAKSRFLANMSHEIRTPMTAILGYTDLLMNPALPADTRAGYLATVRRNAEHLLDLINDILDLSKIEAGKMSLAVGPCPIGPLLADLMSLFRVRAQQRGNTLGVEYCGPVPETIQTDTSRLRQALLNLIGNAVKFTENGSVRVVVTLLETWRPGQPGLRFDVIDTGIGIDPAFLPRLYEPFAQADESTSRMYGGTGLGLSITRNIVQLLDGELKVESTPGKGTTFSMIIPTGDLTGVRLIQGFEETFAQSASTESEAATGANLNGLRLLLAEDSPDNQDLIRILLEGAGAQVTLAEDGQVAVEKAQTGSFDVVLMDMNMPHLDGYQATRRLRQEGYQQPIIALTASAMMNDVDRCLQAGCDAHLAKPIDRARLFETLAKYAAKPPEPMASAQGPSSGVAASQPPAPIVSRLADDPQMAQLLERFVERLPGYLHGMQAALASKNYTELQRFAHRLKGAGGGYGYPSLTEAAARLETAAKQADAEVAAQAVEHLAVLCQAVKLGLDLQTQEAFQPRQES